VTAPTGVRRWLIEAAIAIGLLGLGYALGRFEAPDRVKEERHETQHTVAKEDTSARDEVQRLTAELESLKRDTHSETTLTVKPDGTKVRTRVVDTHVAQNVEVKASEVQTVTVHDVQTVETTKTVTLTKEVDRERPMNRLGVLGGFDARLLSPTVGIVGERRILGPLSLGLFLTVPTRSVQPRSVQAGLSLTVEF
jgi:hypothetical protein